MKAVGAFLLQILWTIPMFGQGFVNLDFEEANIAPTPVGGGVFPADPLEALPGWIVGGPLTSVSYNRESLGGPAVTLMGPEFPNFANYLPLEGSYSVQLYYYSGLYGVPMLSQTGMIPADARSINFLVAPSQNDGVVMLDGAPIPLVAISDGRLAGDVSFFAGTVAQLTFTTPEIAGSPGQLLYFDDIRFSSSPIPEPSTCPLSVMGVLLFWWFARRPNPLEQSCCPVGSENDLPYCHNNWGSRHPARLST